MVAGPRDMQGRGHKATRATIIDPTASQGAPSWPPCSSLAAPGVLGAASWSFPPSFEKTRSQPILAHLPKYARFPCSLSYTPLLGSHVSVLAWYLTTRARRKPLSDRRRFSRHSLSPKREV